MAYSAPFQSPLFSSAPPPKDHLICRYCGQRVKFRELSRHNRRYHSDQWTRAHQRRPRGSSSFKCHASGCGRTFPNHFQLRQHQQTHPPTGRGRNRRQSDQRSKEALQSLASGASGFSRSANPSPTQNFSVIGQHANAIQPNQRFNARQFQSHNRQFQQLLNSNNERTNQWATAQSVAIQSNQPWMPSNQPVVANSQGRKDEWVTPTQANYQQLQSNQHVYQCQQPDQQSHQQSYQQLHQQSYQQSFQQVPFYQQPVTYHQQNYQRQHYQQGHMQRPINHQISRAAVVEETITTGSAVAETIQSYQEMTTEQAVSMNHGIVMQRTTATYQEMATQQTISNCYQTAAQQSVEQNYTIATNIPHGGSLTNPTHNKPYNFGSWGYQGQPWEVKTFRLPSMANNPFFASRRSQSNHVIIPTHVDEDVDMMSVRAAPFDSKQQLSGTQALPAIEYKVKSPTNWAIQKHS
ncbi:hypothetical protein DIURU_000436 [Diutina rugosa]|uniref:C2H2-type domain-containing protein n=1 Tax=Diutina rugosa TaxID=5481 RepID=A0A642UYA7_DIURU|nr:uncharacterized protein DIURU_000436 [Diutina rugosa]KAA8907749.1 hypothetical protein DIURU_000436 [Diutina rugosa]